MTQRKLQYARLMFGVDGSEHMAFEMFILFEPNGSFTVREDWNEFAWKEDRPADKSLKHCLAVGLKDCRLYLIDSFDLV